MDDKELLSLLNEGLRAIAQDNIEAGRHCFEQLLDEVAKRIEHEPASEPEINTYIHSVLANQRKKQPQNLMKELLQERIRRLQELNGQNEHAMQQEQARQAQLHELHELLNDYQNLFETLFDHSQFSPLEIDNLRDRITEIHKLQTTHHQLAQELAQQREANDRSRENMLAFVVGLTDRGVSHE